VGKPPERNDEVERQAHTSSLSRTDRPLSALIAVVGIVLSLLFWGLLRAAEDSNAKRLTSLAAHAIAADLVANSSERMNALSRLSTVMEFKTPPSASEWNSFATMFVQHYPEYLSVEYTDADYQVLAGLSLDDGPSGFGRTFDPALRSAFDTARGRRESVWTPVVFLPNGKKIRRSVAPVFYLDQFRGFVVSRVDVATGLSQMLQNTAGLGYSVEVTEGGQELYLEPGIDRNLHSKWGEVAEAKLASGLIWSIRASPKSQLLSQIHTRLPELAALLPLAFTWLLWTMLESARAQDKHAQELEANSRNMDAALYMRRVAEEEVRESQARFAGILEISSDAIISTDQMQRIVIFNQGAEAIFGYKPEEIIGQSLDILLPRQAKAAHRRYVEEFSNDRPPLRKMGSARIVQGLRKDGTEFPLDATISKLEFKGELIYTAILRDVSERQRAEEELRRAHDELEIKVQERTVQLQSTNEVLQAEVAERKEAEERLRQLSGTLLQTQDEERRRIARELHDSTAQYLVALSLNVAAVQAGAPELPAHLFKLLSDAGLLVDRCTAEIRSLSYLLHPPLLDDLGLTSALEWYAAGFTKRSGVEVQLELSPNIGRLPADHERAYFRIVQECLTNVRRHSGATVAKIRLVPNEHGTLLEVSDDGCGMSGIGQGNDYAQIGVGIAGMRERMRQLGGRLEIESTNEGSVVRAVFLLPHEASISGANA
jgi:PAS domain S-box-containing protein